MNDYELTKHCAEALGLGYVRRCEENPRALEYNADPENEAWMIYCPLDEDGEAMQLVKSFNLEIQPPDEDNPNWVVFRRVGLVGVGPEDLDLNRAIVQCVATMQEEKRLDGDTGRE